MLDGALAEFASLSVPVRRTFIANAGDEGITSADGIIYEKEYTKVSPGSYEKYLKIPEFPLSVLNLR